MHLVPKELSTEAAKLKCFLCLMWAPLQLRGTSGPDVRGAAGEWGAPTAGAEEGDAAAAAVEWSAKARLVRELEGEWEGEGAERAACGCGCAAAVYMCVV